MNKAVLHFFRKHRKHQRNIMNDGGGMLTVFSDGRASQLSFASAPFGEHAASALASARREIHFRNNMRNRK